MVGDADQAFPPVASTCTRSRAGARRPRPPRQRPAWLRGVRATDGPRAEEQLPSDVRLVVHRHRGDRTAVSRALGQSDRSPSSRNRATSSSSSSAGGSPGSRRTLRPSRTLTSAGRGATPASRRSARAAARVLGCPEVLGEPAVGVNARVLDLVGAVDGGARPRLERRTALEEVCTPLMSRAPHSRARSRRRAGCASSPRSRAAAAGVVDSHPVETYFPPLVVIGPREATSSGRETRRGRCHRMPTVCASPGLVPDPRGTAARLTKAGRISYGFWTGHGGRRQAAAR
jgi:hypothetical protein